MCGKLIQYKKNKDTNFNYIFFNYIYYNNICLKLLSGNVSLKFTSPMLLLLAAANSVSKIVLQCFFQYTTTLLSFFFTVSFCLCERNAICHP